VGIDATIGVGVPREGFLKSRIPGQDRLKVEEYLR